MKRITVAVVAGATLLGGCAQPGPTPTAMPDEVNAVAPSVVADEPSPVAGSPVPTTSASPEPVSSASPSLSPTAQPETQTELEAPSPPSESATEEQSVGDAGDREPREQEEAPPSGPAVLLALADAQGDHGMEGPAWADLTALEFVDLGNEVQVTLRFAGALPAAPAEGEVPLIGVDILEQDDGESAYQVFVEGGGQQWGAHLQTPQGFVPFPGTFVLGGRAMQLTLPWNALGSPTRGPVRAFVEWSEERLLLNATSRDTLDGQPHTFDRNP